MRALSRGPQPENEFQFRKNEEHRSSKMTYMSSTENTDLKEMKDRLRRIETRLTKYLEDQGFDTQTRKPSFKNGGIIIHSNQTSIGDILKTVPENWSHSNSIEILHKGELLGRIHPCCLLR